MRTTGLNSKLSHLKKQYDAAVQCNRCGFCETACPTYVASGKETFSPRGRTQALRGLLEGKLKDPKMAAEIFSTCLTCYACTNVCFSEVPVAQLMAAARSMVLEAKTFGFIERFAYRVLLSNRKIFSSLLWTGFFFKRIGIPHFLNAVGLLKILSPELEAAENLVEKVPLSFGFKTRPAGGQKQKMRVAYFSGCGVHYLYPQAAQAVYDLLRDHDVEVLTPDHDCCGLPANSAGDLESAKACAKKNIELFASLDVEAIIVNDDSCAGFMMRYGEVLKGDPEAAIFSKKVMNLSQFLTKLHWSEESFERDISGARVHIRFAPLQSEPALGERSREKEFRAKVTYHHPCQMGNGHKETEAPLHILRSIAGKNFVELDEANWCCGGAGIYCLKNPKLAEAVLDRKIANIKKSGAGIVVTEASSCLLHINAGLKKKGLGEKVRCVHLGEFLSGRD